MKNFYWLLTSIFLFVLSGIISWFIPEGINLISQQLGQNTYPVTPLIRLFTFMFSFLFMIGVEMIIWIRIEINSLKEELPKTLARNLFSESKNIVNNSILQILINSLNQNPQNLGTIYHLCEEFAYPLSKLPSGVLDSYLVVIEGFVRKFNEDINSLGRDSCLVNLREHLETTKWISEKSKVYLQIQRKAFLVPDEWTNQWCQFLDWIKNRQISCEYIVLLDKQSLVSERKKLESMNSYLSQRGFTFKCCVLEDVQDSLGGTLPTQENVEVFDNKIIKLQSPPAGVYKGGIALKMTLFDISQRDDISRFVNYVTNFAEKFS